MSCNKGLINDRPHSMRGTLDLKKDQWFYLFFLLTRSHSVAWLYSGTQCVDQAVLKLSAILLPRPPKH